MKRLILILLIPLLLLACNSDDEINGELVPYSSDNYPITFLKPELWTISDDEDSITIASKEGLLFANTVTEGARINIIVTQSFFTGSANAMEVIDRAVRDFRDSEGAEIIQDIESKTINTQSAVETVLRGKDSQGNEVIFRYLVIENLVVNQTAVVAAVHDANQNDQYGQLMVDIISSIQLEDVDG